MRLTVEQMVSWVHNKLPKGLPLARDETREVLRVYAAVVALCMKKGIRCPLWGIGHFAPRKVRGGKFGISIRSFGSFRDWMADRRPYLFKARPELTKED